MDLYNWKVPLVLLLAVIIKINSFWSFLLVSPLHMNDIANWYWYLCTKNYKVVNTYQQVFYSLYKY